MNRFQRRREGHFTNEVVDLEGVVDDLKRTIKKMRQLTLEEMRVSSS